MPRPKFWVNLHGTQVAGGEEARVGDSLCLEQDMALFPHRFAYKPPV
jgi:hypothetical protein